jgi:hypothetical protein
MTNLKYLGGIIPFTFVLFFLIVLLVGYLFKNPSYTCWKHDQSPIRNKDKYNNFQRYFYGLNYQSVYRSGLENLIQKQRGIYILFAWRLSCFLFFFGIPFLYGYIHFGGNSAIFFTIWNIDLISLFYFLVTVASGIGIIYDSEFSKSHSGSNIDETPDLSFWSNSIQNFGYALQILFEIAGSTAFFVTVVDFATLNHEFQFWNVCQHFMTTMSFLVEISLNSMIVRWEHVLFTIAWAMMYLIFIWSMTASDAVSHWPYFFLNTGTPAVFLWYPGLFLGLFIFYYLFWWVSDVRYRLIDYLERRYDRVPLISPKRNQNKLDSDRMDSIELSAE